MAESNLNGKTNLDINLVLSFEKLKENIINIKDIGDQLFEDDLETLKLVMYSYQYVDRMLTTPNVNEQLPLDLRDDLLKQQKVLPSRMLNALKRIETQCKIQLDLYEKYNESLFLGSKRNTELILHRIQQTFSRNKKSPFTGVQLMKYISKLLININAILGRDITVSEVDVKALTCTDITLDSSDDWKYF